MRRMKNMMTKRRRRRMSKAIIARATTSRKLGYTIRKRTNVVINKYSSVNLLSSAFSEYRCRREAGEVVVSVAKHQ